MEECKPKLLSFASTLCPRHALGECPGLPRADVGGRGLPLIVGCRSVLAVSACRLRPSPLRRRLFSALPCSPLFESGKAR